MIKTKKELKEWIDYESIKYNATNKIKYCLQYFFKISESAILLHHQILLRKAEYYTNLSKKLPSIIYRALLHRQQNKYMIHVPLNTCGKGLKIMHLGPILINGKARLGEDCTLHINTAIVAGGTNDYVPTLGNHVVVGVGSTLLGKIEIADYIAIGAGSVVNKSFAEENIAIAGVPAKKISNNGSKEWNKKDKK